MDLIARIGRLFVSVAMVIFGIQQFIYTGVIAGLNLVPEWIPAHTFCAYLTGTLLIAAGVSIAIEKKGRLAATLLAVGFCLTIILLRMPTIALILPDLRERTRVFETLTMCAGCLVLAASIPGDEPHTRRASIWVQNAGDVGRLLLAVSMAVFGLSHIVIPNFIASLIPSWIPWHLFWAYFTAIVFFAAAVSFAFKIQMRFIGFSLGLMLFLWVIVLHAPRVAAALHNGDEWNSAFVALAMSGFAFVVAGGQTTTRRPRSAEFSS